MIQAGMSQVGDPIRRITFFNLTNEYQKQTNVSEEQSAVGAYC
jgi:hypothetical protein